MNTTEKRRLGSQRAEAYSDGLKPRTANPPKIEPRNFILFKLIEAQPNTSNYSPRTKNGSPTGIFPFPLGLYQPNPIPPRPQRIRGERRGHASAPPPHDAGADVTSAGLGADANDATAQVATPPAPHLLRRHGGSRRPQTPLLNRPPFPLRPLRRGAPPQAPRRPHIHRRLRRGPRAAARRPRARAARDRGFHRRRHLRRHRHRRPRRRPRSTQQSLGSCCHLFTRVWRGPTTSWCKRVVEFAMTWKIRWNHSCD